MSEGSSSGGFCSDAYQAALGGELGVTRASKASKRMALIPKYRIQRRLFWVLWRYGLHVGVGCSTCQGHVRLSRSGDPFQISEASPLLPPETTRQPETSDHPLRARQKSQPCVPTSGGNLLSCTASRETDKSGINHSRNHHGYIEVSGTWTACRLQLWATSHETYTTLGYCGLLFWATWLSM